jgi:hypothetical protein
MFKNYDLSLTHCPTNAMAQSPAWETNNCSVSREILSILRNPPGTYPEPDESS